VTTAFIGAGRMGGAMVRRLLDHGHPVVVHTRRAETRDQLESYGATTSDDIAQVVSGADLVLSCLFDEHQVQQVLDGPGGVASRLERGSVLVVHSTISPAQVRSLDARARERRASVLDAPVSGSADDILAGRLTVMAGGTVEALDAARPAIETYCSSLIATGGLGSASATKLVNNLLFAAGTQLAAGALALGEQLGVEQRALLDALSVSSGQSEALRRMAMSPSVEAHEARTREFLIKDVALALAAADESGVEVDLFRRVLEDGSMNLTGTRHVTRGLNEQTERPT